LKKSKRKPAECLVIRTAYPGEQGITCADRGQQGGAQLEPQALGGIRGRSGCEAIAVIGDRGTTVEREREIEVTNIGSSNDPQGIGFSNKGKLVSSADMRVRKFREASNLGIIVTVCVGVGGH